MRQLPDADRTARALVVVGAGAALFGLAYLVWRWTSPSECAWASPDIGDWLAGGVRPSVTDTCALRPGSVVTGAIPGAADVDLLLGAADPVVLPLEPSGPLVLQRLRDAAASLAFCGGFFALSVYASLRRRADRDAATTVVISGALLGSTIVTMVGLPVHLAFGGPARWAFVAATAPVYLLAWGVGLAWLLRFPTPLLPAAAWGPAMVGPTVLWAMAAVPLWLASDSFTGWLRASIIVQSSLTVTALVGWLVILAIRWRQERVGNPGSVARQQFLWIAGSATVAGLLTLSLWLVPALLTGQALLPDELIGAPGLFFVVGFAIAVLRHRMFDLDPWLARTVLYAGLTLAAVVVYLVATAVLTAGLVTLAPAQVAAIGAVLAAVVVNPLRVRIERWVNRVMYGSRDEPYAALSAVAAQVADRGVTDSRSVDDIRRVLRAPYVRISRADGSVVAAGDPDALAAGAVELPLEHAGACLGTMEIAVRGPGERYGPGERRLLADLARQVGIGLHEERLAGELQRSRERIVTAREEERRALRRELHDQIGPTMAAVSLRAETARRQLQRDPGALGSTDRQLASIRTDASSAAESLRRMAYQLRPPALDEHGLVVALTQHAATVAHPQVRVEGDVGQEPLSAAAEAALYWIAVAAVSNVVAHAGAEHCRITLRRTATTMVLTVADDGRGLPPGTPRGVGITSMIERAAELGGTCTVTDASPGTLVRAELPVGAAS
jgi:signal transduction histidine kinase